MPSERRILLEHTANPEAKTLDFYLSVGGYEAAKKAITRMSPQEVIDAVKESGLRGRGGAAFPTGLKWDFVPKDDPRPRFVIANCDEGEPGTFKDREIVERYPHLLIEGMIIAGYAIGARQGFIYIRGEYPGARRTLRRAIAEAEERGFLGERLFGTDFSFNIRVYSGAGAYICGEETALIESLEGKRGHPRLRPPYPVSKGYLDNPTVVNNVETLSNVPFIVKNGPDWYKQLGTPKSTGTKIFTVSGAVRKPGVFEFELGSLTLRELIYEVAGGPRGNLVGVIPGGLSTPVLLPEEIDVRLDYESLAEAGSLLGSGAVIVIDQSVPIWKVAWRALRFMAHESCGKCTPCRQGTHFLEKAFARAAEGDTSLLGEAMRVAEIMAGKCFCPLGEGAAAMTRAFISKYHA